MKDLSTTKPLLRAIKDLELALQKPYEPYPDNPRTDFFNATASALFFLRLTFKDLVERQEEDICHIWALVAAIAIGDFDETKRLFKIEFGELNDNSINFEESLKSVELTLQHHGRAEWWQELKDINKLP